MDTMTENLQRQVNELVETHRDRCLWFLRSDYYPADVDSALRALHYIQRHGDLKAFQRAGELIQWLSPHSSKPSVGA